MDDVLSFCLLVVVECCGILSLLTYYYLAYSLYFLPSVLL